MDFLYLKIYTQNGPVITGTIAHKHKGFSTSGQSGLDRRHDLTSLGFR